MRLALAVLLLFAAGCTDQVGPIPDDRADADVPHAGCGHMAQDACGECPWRKGCPVPAMDAEPEIEIHVNDTAAAGTRVEVRARNVGSSTFSYSLLYEACRMTFHTDDGRQFLVPEGTHCDIANPGTIRPGQVVTLFTWGLEECTLDQWGCVEREPLRPGTYHLRDTLCIADPDGYGGDCEAGSTRTGATIRIY